MVVLVNVKPELNINKLIIDLALNYSRFFIIKRYKNENSSIKNYRERI